jgi:hypothetical protein
VICQHMRIYTHTILGKNRITVMVKHLHNFHVHTAHLDIINVFYPPSDAQVNCLENNFKIYIKIGIKTAPANSVEFRSVQHTYTNKGKSN